MGLALDWVLHKARSGRRGFKESCSLARSYRPIGGCREAEIRAAAAQGLSPHDSGNNDNPDITLTVSVPEGVTLGTSPAKSTSSMIAYTSFSPGAERTQVTANIQLRDLNWQQLLDIYDA